MVNTYLSRPIVAKHVTKIVHEIKNLSRIRVEGELINCLGITLQTTESKRRIYILMQRKQILADFNLKASESNCRRIHQKPKDGMNAAFQQKERVQETATVRIVRQQFE
jgi:hypothetical protein